MTSSSTVSSPHASSSTPSSMPLLIPQSQSFSHYKGFYQFFRIEVRVVPVDRSPGSIGSLNIGIVDGNGGVFSQHQQDGFLFSTVREGIDRSIHNDANNHNLSNASPHAIHIVIHPLPPQSQRRIYKLLARRIRHSANIDEVVRELKDVLDLLARDMRGSCEMRRLDGMYAGVSSYQHHFGGISATPLAAPLSKSYYLWLQTQLSNVGYQNINSMDARTEHVAMKYIDTKAREHVIQVRNLKGWYEKMASAMMLSSGKAPFSFSSTDENTSGMILATSASSNHEESAHPHSTQQIDVPNNPTSSVSSSTPPLTLQHQLPIPDFKIQVPNSSHLLSNILKQFSHQVDQLQLFWDQMDDLDQNTWIIEPSHPNRSHSNRSISIGQHCSIRIQVDPIKPNLIPVCEFIGSDTIVNPLKERWMRQAPSMWNYDLRKNTLLQNMGHVLEIQFPSPKESNNEEDEEEHKLTCGICYYMHSESNELPAVVCENVKCLKPYHWSCIIEWFNAQQAKSTFDMMHGECLYCGSGMTVKKRA
uniref:RING-type domain-containing protein n=1 Tax=Percolomonas cosmopolitus TaxID=63605 RepID=A0A7S1KMA8_9EUKA